MSYPLWYAALMNSQKTGSMHQMFDDATSDWPGGDLIIAGAKEVLKLEFPELTGKIAFHSPDEKEKRHGQAVAAASLPKLG